MSSSQVNMCYKCDAVPGTEECIRTGRALCDQCNPSSYYNMLINLKNTVDRGVINTGMFPKIKSNYAEDTKITLRELCQYSETDTIVQYGMTNTVCHMFYRHKNKKCYSFYLIRHVTPPHNIYEITEEFIESL